jgi:nucleoside-diphosphate-sugar epimerase
MEAERILLAGGGDLALRVAQHLAGGTKPAIDPPRRSADASVAAPRTPLTASASAPVSASLSSAPALWALRRQPPADDGSPVQWLAADLTQPGTLAGLPAGITRVVYALAPGARSEAAYRAVFIDGLRNLLQALDKRRLQRVVFVSSSAVYGEHGGAWVDETTPPAPLGMNGAVLLEAEQWLQAQDLSAITLRLAGLYGPGRLQLVDRLRAGQARVPRATPHWANRMHADDAAAAIAHLLMLPAVQDSYIGADDTPLPLDTLYDHIAGVAGCPLPAEGPAPAGVGSKRLCNARLRASGFVPAWPDARDGYAALLTGPGKP